MRLVYSTFDTNTNLMKTRIFLETAAQIESISFLRTKRTLMGKIRSMRINKINDENRMKRIKKENSSKRVCVM